MGAYHWFKLAENRSTKRHQPRFRSGVQLSLVILEKAEIFFFFLILFKDTRKLTTFAMHNDYDGKWNVAVVNNKP